MVDMSATSTRAALLPKAQHRGFAERLAVWILTRSDRRLAAKLDRLAWDLEARCDRPAGTDVQLGHHVVLPPGGGLF